MEVREHRGGCGTYAEIKRLVPEYVNVESKDSLTKQMMKTNLKKWGRRKKETESPGNQIIKSQSFHLIPAAFYQNFTRKNIITGGLQPTNGLGTNSGGTCEQRIPYNKIH